MGQTKNDNRPRPQSGLTNGIQATTRENDGFPFPDYKQSSRGQVLRADINYRNQLLFPSKAEINLSMQSPSGRTLNFPQTTEMAERGPFQHYGLEARIPRDAELGRWNMWASINGREVPGSRQPHDIIDADPINRYQSYAGGQAVGPIQRQQHPTLSYDSSFGRQSALRALLNRAISGGF